MKLNYNCIVWAFMLISVASADAITPLPQLFYTKKQLAVTACAAYIAKQATLFGKKDTVGFCNIKNQPAFGTMTICLNQGFANETALQKSSIDFFLNNYCKGYNLTLAEYDAAFQNASKHAINTVTTPGFNKTKLWSTPIKLKTTGIAEAYLSDYTRFFNYNYSLWFGVALLGYWFAVILLAGVCNLSYYLFPKFVNSCNGTTSKMFRKYISLPAFVGRDHVAASNIFSFVWAYFPTRLESLLIFGWFILAFVFCAVNIEKNTPNFIWVKVEAQMGRKVADRSAFLSLFLFPANILFAGRNNFLQWVSGWSYSRFIALHKWTSRITFVLCVVHGISMSCSGIGLGKYQSRNHTPLDRLGYVALIAMVMMLISGQAYFRRKYYELFLLSHILMAVVFLIAGFYHVRQDSFQVFFYASVGVWAFDRVVRLVRLFAFGVRKAKIELKADEILKVTVPRPKYWHPTPGGHAFVHFLRPSCFWQSHPFTYVDTSSITNANTITFYIKIKGGVTHGLYRYLEQQEGKASEVNVMIEGPYGQRLPVDRIDNVVFIATGNGVPGLFSEAMHLAKRQSEKATKVIKYHWIIRELKSIEWFIDELKQMENTKIQTIIHISRPVLSTYIETQSSDDEKYKEAESKNVDSLAERLKRELSFIEFREARPNVEELIKQEIQELEGSKCFVSCAHPQLCDDIRYTIAHNLDLSKDRVDYFEQIQTW